MSREFTSFQSKSNGLRSVPALAVVGGSPNLALAARASAPVAVNAEPRRESAPATGTGCDPTLHPHALTISVRAFHATEITLQRVCAGLGLTFWGEAVALIFDLYAANPGLADLSDLEDAPRGLTAKGGAIRHPGAPTSRGIMAPLSTSASDWITRTANSKRIGRERLASLILHRHASAAAALILAAQMGRE